MLRSISGPCRFARRSPRVGNDGASFGVRSFHDRWHYSCTCDPRVSSPVNLAINPPKAHQVSVRQTPRFWRGRAPVFARPRRPAPVEGVFRRDGGNLCTWNIPCAPVFRAGAALPAPSAGPKRLVFPGVERSGIWKKERGRLAGTSSRTPGTGCRLPTPSAPSPGVGPVTAQIARRMAGDDGKPSSMESHANAGGAVATTERLRTPLAPPAFGPQVDMPAPR